jgi:hypothetical protein
VKFETFEVQKVNDMTVLQFHQSGPFELFTIYTSGMPAIFPVEIPNCHSMHQFRLALDRPGPNSVKQREDMCEK